MRCGTESIADHLIYGFEHLLDYGKERLYFVDERFGVVSLEVHDDFDTEDSIVFILNAHEPHQLIDDFGHIRCKLVGCICGKAVENFEDTIS